ncbi:hypothetical protein Gohar_002840, partial [Gossypium harknessii]|nr:hypothetical protein [Gossypium harknessii]
MQGTDELSIDDLASSLSTYKEQLQQVRQLLADDPGNAEYVDMEKELAEESTCCSMKQRQLTANGNGSAGGVLCVVMASLLLIHLISDVHLEILKELLATAKQNEISGSDIGTSVSAAAAQSK